MKSEKDHIQLFLKSLVTMNNFNVGIIGSSGFIGKSLVKRILNNKNKDLQLYLFSRRIDNIFNNLTNVTFTSFDVQNFTHIPDELFEIEVLYYLVSDTIPASSWNNCILEVTNNLLPFIHIIEKLTNGNLKKIVYTSSAGTVYGSSEYKITENSETSPFSPYGITKLTIEHFLHYFQIKHSISYDIFRISNIYGPGQITSKGLGLINTILENHANKEETIIFGDGKNVRNYIYIDDVVNILEKSIYSSRNESNTINLASSDNISIVDLIQIIENSINEKLLLKYEMQRASDNPCISIDNSRLLNKYIDIKITSLHKGILNTYDSILKSKKK